LAMNGDNIQGLRTDAIASGAPQAYPLAAAINGIFAPMFEHPELEPAPGLMVVISNSELFHNVTLAAESSGNIEFAANLADWLAQDSALIELRSRGKKGRPVTDFAREYVDSHGGWVDGDEAHNEELDRAAQDHRRSRRRLVSWGNVLVPPLLVLLFALLHRSYHGRRARQPFKPGARS